MKVLFFIIFAVFMFSATAYAKSITCHRQCDVRGAHMGGAEKASFLCHTGYWRSGLVYHIRAYGSADPTEEWTFTRALLQPNKKTSAEFRAYCKEEGTTISTSFSGKTYETSAN